MSKVVPIQSDAALREIARDRFAEYTQSVAFHLTLSRHMIEALGLIRDIGNLWHDDESGWKSRTWCGRNSVTVARALTARGLVIHHPLPERKDGKVDWAKAMDGRPSYSLTRAGELVTEMLVEAKLIPAASSAAKKRARP